MEKGERSSVDLGMIDLDGSWVERMGERLQEVPYNERSPGYTIYRVPEMFRKVDKEAANVYEPDIISIGPYHHGKPNLHPMETHKWRSLYHYLSRNPDKRLVYYLREMKAKESELRSCYSEIIDMGSNDFVEMMLLDGCFILEYFLDPENSLLDSKIWVFSRLWHDLLLLENQIPFSILQWLYDLIKAPDHIPLSVLGLGFLTYYSRPLNPNKIPPTETTHHLLHLYHSYLMPTPEFSQKHHSNLEFFMFKMKKQVLSLFGALLRRTTRSSGNEVPSAPPLPPLTIPSATELHEAGVKFMKKEADSLLDIEFSNGVMRIPHLLIHQCTESHFKNLIVFEQCYLKSHTQFTNYALFMDLIVNTTTDIELLSQNKILLHGMGSHEEVALLFNELGRGAVADVANSYLAPLFKEVTDYYDSTWHVWRAKLKRDYFSNPWAIISVVAAFILLSVTITQTVFTILPYVQQY